MPDHTFPAKFEYLDEIREHVANVARSNGFSEKTIYTLQLAADEAASNIIEHAYEGTSDGTLFMSCTMNGDSIVITMRDHGTPFNPAKVREPNLKADLSERQIGGLGVYLMRKLMDTVTYKTSNSGNVLTMTKKKE